LTRDGRRTASRTLGKPWDGDFAVLSGLTFEADEILVDIGANRGQSIDSMRLFFPSQRIAAFEPNPVLASKLRKQFEKDRNTQIIQCGLGKETQQFELSVPCYNGWDFDGCGSFRFAAQNQRWIANSIFMYKPDKLTFKRHVCLVRSLDEFGLKAGFIKIDTEGFEYDVLHGALRTISQYAPAIMMENSNPECNGVELLKLGYQAFNFQAGDIVQGLGGRNTLYLHPRRMPSMCL
jgi:FkbM family methyltransferase